MRLGPFCLATLSLLSASTLLTSCNSSHMGNQPVALALQGRAMGGEQPISDSTIQIYEVGTTTDGGPSTPLLTETVTTSDGTGQINANANAGNDDNQLPAGSFTISGDFSCPSASTLVYLAAIGGNPGDGTNAVQENLLALGECGSLSSSTHVVINEITTVGTVRALSSYMTAYNSVGSSTAHATALASAFTAASEYINPNSGQAPGPSLPAGYDADSNDLRALANVVQSCVNSTGNTSSGYPCGMFFRAAQGTAASMPGDTITALLDVFADPTNNVSTLFNLQGTTPAFEPTNTSAPPDWTLPILQVPATPSISPNGGSFTSIQTVTITDTDTDSTNAIYYTTDGSTPSATNGTLYTSSFTVSSSETINAIDIDDNHLSSSVATASFTVIFPLPTPTVGLTPVTAVNGQTTTQTITATSNANGSVVTFGVTFPADGTFSPATCTIVAGTCSVNYQPSGALPTGTYPNDLTATFSATSSYTAAAATSTLTISGVTFNSLYSFANSGDGGNIADNLIQASDGNFYGTTQIGGSNSQGSIFRLTPSGNFTTIYSFANNGDGSAPDGNLVQASDGNLYGTTFTTVFKISLSGNLTTLHTFGQADGFLSYAGLTQGTDGNFYGVTAYGGAIGWGTLFQITPSGSLTVLHNFTGQDDGGNPSSTLVQGTDGFLYGVSPIDGANNHGVVFKCDTSGNFTSLYSFQNGSDGGDPFGSLIEGADGNLYGTTVSGGAGNGVVYKITPSGTPTTLYTFQNGQDGAGPNAGVILGSDGNFYGTDASVSDDGGGGDYGKIFSLTPSGNFTTLYSFSNYGQDGSGPRAGLVQGADGNFYGSSHGLGGGFGNLYNIALTPTLAAPIKLTVPAGAVGGSTFAISYSVANATSATMKNCFAGLTDTSGNFTALGTLVGSQTTTNAILPVPTPPTGGNYTFSLTCGGQETSTAPFNIIVFSIGAKPASPTR